MNIYRADYFFFKTFIELRIYVPQNNYQIYAAIPPKQRLESYNSQPCFSPLRVLSGAAIHLAHFSFVPFALMLFAGCNNDESGRLAISGTIQLDDQPLDGIISFGPQGSDGTQASAIVVDGKFVVKKIKGLTPGKYLVKIFSTESEASSTSGAEIMDRDNDSNVKPAKQKVPPEYNTDSQQFIDVSIEGKNKFDFNINT